MTTKPAVIHFRAVLDKPFNACNGRTNDRTNLTHDRAAVTCKRCAAKYPAVVKCPTCGRQVAHDALEFCPDDLTRCKGGCLEKFLEREAAHAGKVPEVDELHHVKGEPRKTFAIPPPPEKPASAAEARKAQAECTVAYTPCPTCGDAPNIACGLCRGGPGVPLALKPARDSFNDRLTLCDSLRCKCGMGAHVNHKDSEAPKLEGRPSAEVLKRILATRMWRGSTVEESRQEVVVEPANRKHPARSEVRPVYIVTHPSRRAVMLLRADL